MDILHVPSSFFHLLYSFHPGKRIFQGGKRLCDNPLPLFRRGKVEDPQSEEFSTFVSQSGEGGFSPSISRVEAEENTFHRRRLVHTLRCTNCAYVMHANQCPLATGNHK